MKKSDIGIDSDEGLLFVIVYNKKNHEVRVISELPDKEAKEILEKVIKQYRI
jgi:hypothetical protein